MAIEWNQTKGCFYVDFDTEGEWTIDRVGAILFLSIISEAFGFGLLEDFLRLFKNQD